MGQSINKQNRIQNLLTDKYNENSQQLNLCTLHLTVDGYA